MSLKNHRVDICAKFAEVLAASQRLDEIERFEKAYLSVRSVSGAELRFDYLPEGKTYPKAERLGLNEGSGCVLREVIEHLHKRYSEKVMSGLGEAHKLLILFAASKLEIDPNRIAGLGESKAPVEIKADHYIVCTCSSPSCKLPHEGKQE